MKKPKSKLKTIYTIDRMAVMRGIHNSHQLHEVTGISYPRISKLWQGKGCVEPDDLDTLCEVLRCNIKDLIKRVPTSGEE